MTERIIYRNSAPYYHFVGAIFLAAIGIALASTRIQEPMSLGSWVLALDQSSAYVKEWAQQSFKTRNILPIHQNASLFIAGALLIPLISVSWVILVLIAYAAPKKNYGKMANGAEVRNMGLHGNLGPVLGIHNGTILKPDELRHTIALAPTRSGKTRQAISTILDFPGSIVVVDPKKQIKEITKSYRQKLGPTFAISFANPQSEHGWNPFAIRNLPTEDVQIELYANRLGAILAPADSTSKDPFWNDTALRNVTALIACEIYQAISNNTDGHIRNLVNSLTDLPHGVDDPFQEKMFLLAAQAANHGAPVWVYNDLRAFGSNKGNERNSHVSTLLSKLQVFRGKATEKSLGLDDFTVSELRLRPSTVYIDFPIADARAFGPITAIFMEAIFQTALTNGRQEDEYPILIILDEFRDLPVFPSLIPVMTAGAGAGICAYIITQDLSQLKEKYGEASPNIINNAEYFIVFENPDPQTQRDLTAKTGKTLETKNSKSTTSIGWTKGRNVSTQDTELIAPEDWGVIPFGKHVLLARRHLVRPVFCKTAFWDKIPRYKKRVPRAARIKT